MCLEKTFFINKYFYDDKIFMHNKITKGEKKTRNLAFRNINLMWQY